MKQILQNLKNGETILEEVPVPNAKSGHLLIQTSKTLISAGTERMLVDFGKANFIDKARQQPDKVKQVIQKVKTDGLMPTVNAVRNKLDQPLPLGYCNVGKVIEIGPDVDGFAVGDRVLSNGKHAEYVVVPKNLCSRIPDSVLDESAVFSVIGAIALQGIRLAKPTLGETFVVTGLGLIGLVAVQLLRANGCRVIGLDFDEDKLELAKKLGAIPVNLKSGEDPVKTANLITNNNGVDGVLITASTKSNEPVHQAATMCRKRGRIILVGVTGLELSRADFYQKELSFQVSCSYGPGRYDSNYEDKGMDYPFGLVRWTEQRNFEAILGLLENGQLDVKELISHRFEINDAKQAYDVVSEGSPLGIIINYPNDEVPISNKRNIHINEKRINANSQIKIGFIGAGNYASQILIPAFAKTDSELVSISSASGTTSVHAAKKYNIQKATTDTNSLIQANDNNVVVITTRHDSHAKYIIDCLENKKHIFVEKPLAINQSQLNDIKDIYDRNSSSLLMVGFNRRFSPLTDKVRDLLSITSGPVNFIMTVNAGEIPAEHWTQDNTIGGGRIIGEACHFIDLLRYLANSPISSIQSERMGNNNTPGILKDNVSITMKYENGSMGVIHYLANGSKAFPKERLEIFSNGSILHLDNFRKLKAYDWPQFRGMSLRSQDKGNSQCVKKFTDAIFQGNESPIPFSELVEVTEATFDVMQQIQ